MEAAESEEEVAAARRVEDLPEQYEHEHVGQQATPTGVPKMPS